MTVKGPGKARSCKPLKTRPRRAEVAAMSRPLRSQPHPATLRFGDVTGSPVRRRVEVIHVPGLRPDGRRHAERKVLRELEGLEVVEHEGLADLSAQLAPRHGEQK